MADEDLNRPYIGYRSAGRRPESQQDRRAAADAPLAALRGFLSGVLGAPGDIESLVRMLPGLSERTILPTSEDVERRLPLRSVSETPIGRVATTGGQLAGGFYTGPGSPLKAAAALPSAVSRAGREFLQSTAPVHVIKPKGGNWLTGSVEEALTPLKRGLPERPGEAPRNVPPGVSWRGMISAMRNEPEGLQYLDELRTTNPEAYARLYPDAALNKWLETKLAKYMRNEMATPEDPLRALAARGISHLPEDTLAEAQGWVPEGVGAARVKAGYPYEGYAWKAHQAAGFPEGAAADLARSAEGWENLADIAITPERVADLRLLGEYSPTVRENPWLAKVAPETSVYSVDASAAQDLGFPHLVDELRNALNPESGLPANLLLTPEQLSRVSTPQAVELVHKINQYRAAEKAAADAARAQNTATVLHKEYPEAGYRWVELKAPEGTPSAYLGGGKFEDPMANALQDALKYEGDVMGHCVGGYCPDVLEGKSRIFSLRSAKGEPHVTIEVAPPRESAFTYWNKQRMGVDDELKSFHSWLQENHDNLPEGGLDAWYPLWAQATGREVVQPPASIVQIKGKQNKPPKAEYLPFVQDFVRSQKWGQVGDIQNAGLRRFTDAFNENEIKKIQEAGIDVPEWATPQEIKAIGDQVWPGLYGNPPGFASGGLVTYNPAEVDDLTNQLRAELGLQ